MGLDITWTNHCKTQSWNIGQSEWNPPLTGRMAKLPQDTLQAYSGFTEMEMTVTLQDAENMGEMICVWWTQYPNQFVYWFGTQLYQPVNVGHVGYSPYYAICTGRVASPNDIPQLKMESIIGSPGQDLWRRPVSDPAQTYYFDAASDQLPPGLKIGYVPTAGGEDLKVEVSMSDV